MRNVQRLIAAAVLTCVLALPVFAGHIDTGRTGPQPSPSPSSATVTTETASISGHIDTGVTTPDSLTGMALSLINSLLALL